MCCFDCLLSDPVLQSPRNSMSRFRDEPCLPLCRKCTRSNIGRELDRSLPLPWSDISTLHAEQTSTPKAGGVSFYFMLLLMSSSLFLLMPTSITALFFLSAFLFSPALVFAMNWYAHHDQTRHVSLLITYPAIGWKERTAVRLFSHPLVEHA